jgi:hypothetical protein
MKTLKLLISLSIILALTLSLSNCGTTEVKAGNKATDTLIYNETNNLSRFIAGLSVQGNTFDEFTKTKEWAKYQKESNISWAKFDSFALKVTSWKAKELPKELDTIKTLFYPFSGPDYLYANMFFPNAEKIILIGLESPGSIPVFDASVKDSLKAVFNLYNRAIEDVMNLSFFRTNDMKNELANKTINGTAPIIMLFLARSGKEVLSVTPMELNNEGKFYEVKNKKNYTAVEIKFKNTTDTITRTIYYLSTNLADPSLSKNKPFIAFLNNIDNNCVSFVKSATYLMHKSYFSIIRNTVINKSAYLIQDDSGIAYKFFDKKKWDITLYGVYNKPIKLFEEFYEADLFEAYKSIDKKLPFRFGYNSKSSMLIAHKK